MAQSRATLASQPASAMQTTHQLQPARPQLNWLDLCDILCSTLRIIMPHSYTMPGTLCITGSSFVRKYARMDSTSNHPTISYIFPDKAFDRSCTVHIHNALSSSKFLIFAELPWRAAYSAWTRAAPADAHRLHFFLLHLFSSIAL